MKQKQILSITPKLIVNETSNQSFKSSLSRQQNSNVKPIRQDTDNDGQILHSFNFPNYFFSSDFFWFRSFGSLRLPPFSTLLPSALNWPSSAESKMPISSIGTTLK